MREKLLFAGMLVMSVLYCIEVISNGEPGVLNYIGLALAFFTIVPWLVSVGVSISRKKKEREAKKALKEAEKQAENLKD